VWETRGNGFLRNLLRKISIIHVWETRGKFGFHRNLLGKISIIHVWQTRGNGFLEVSWWGRFPQPILPESSLLSVVDVGAAVQLGSNPIQSVYKHDEERRLT
jgi:hypothetical protein